MEDGRLTVAEAAGRLGVKTGAILAAIDRGRLAAQLVTPRAGRPYYLIRPEDLDAYDRERRAYHPNRWKGET